MRRKLSTSLAVMGDLSVVLMDEPTSGMDVISRQNVWNVIAELQKDGKSVLFSSHCMEDYEALCTRMAILVDGECRCIGSSQSLKSRYCRGLELKIKVKPDE